MAKKNKTIAGYHLLMILSVVDDHLDPREDMVIREFLIEEFPPPIPIQLDNEMDILSSLTPDQYESHFSTMLSDFYDDSTREDRLRLLDFAAGLIRADQTIHDQENKYLREMISSWQLAKPK